MEFETHLRNRTLSLILLMGVPTVIGFMLLPAFWLLDISVETISVLIFALLVVSRPIDWYVLNRLSKEREATLSSLTPEEARLNERSRQLFNRPAFRFASALIALVYVMAVLGAMVIGELAVVLVAISFGAVALGAGMHGLWSMPRVKRQLAGPSEDDERQGRRLERITRTMVGVLGLGVVTLIAYALKAWPPAGIALAASTAVGWVAAFVLLKRYKAYMSAP